MYLGAPQLHDDVAVNLGVKGEELIVQSFKAILSYFLHHYVNTDTGGLNHYSNVAGICQHYSSVE